MDLSYSYVNARVKAMKSRLLKETVVKEMLEVGSVNEVVELLEEDAVYKPFLVKLSSEYSGTELVSRALQENLSATLKKIYFFLPKKAREKFRILSMELEIRDLKTIIAKKVLGLEVVKGDLVNASEQNAPLIEKMLKAHDYTEALAALRKSEYGSVFPESLVKQFEKTKDFRILAGALNDYYSAFLTKTLQAEKDALVKKLLQDRLDYTNAVLSLRLKKTGLSEKEITPRLTQPLSRKVRHVLASKSYSDGVSIAEKEFHVTIPANERESIARVEVALERKFVENALRDFRLSVLSFGAVLGYYYLKLIELSNIQKIVYATNFGVKDELKDAVFAVNL